MSVATETPSGKRIERVGAIPVLAIQLVHLLIFPLVLKDWLLSTSTPYPYAASFAATGFLGLALAGWRLSADRILDAAAGISLLLFPIALQERSGALAALAGFSAVALTRKDLSPLRTALHVGAILTGVFLASETGTLVPLGVACGVALACELSGRSRRLPLREAAVIATAALWAVKMWPGSKVSAQAWEGDPWMGAGMAFEAGGRGTAATVAHDFGLITVWALCLGVPLMVAIVAPRWLSTRSAENVLPASMAGALGLLAGLACQPDSRPAFLAAGAIGGSAALAFAFFALCAAVASPPVTAPRPRAHRRGRKVLAIGLLGLTGLLLAGWVPAAMAVNARFPAERRRAPLPSSNASPAFRDATVAMEDGHFYGHRGFDLAAIHRALRVNLRQGRVRQGGSTITQQLAKNLFLEEDRTVWRKVREAFLTVELERRLSKTEILDAYLNTIDYGLGCRGIAAASQTYFRKPPSELTLAESAALVGIVPAPPKETLDLGKLQRGKDVALSRVAFFFPERYSTEEIQRATEIPVDRIVKPLNAPAGR